MSVDREAHGGHWTVTLPLNSEDERYARAVRLAARSMDMVGIRKSAGATRDVMHQLASLEQHYLHLERSALATVSGVTGSSKLALIPFFRKAAEKGTEVAISQDIAITFKPTRLTLTARSR